MDKTTIVYKLHYLTKVEDTKKSNTIKKMKKQYHDMLKYHQSYQKDQSTRQLSTILAIDGIEILIVGIVYPAYTA
jgi:uncharacterized ion transporter superfamily protein YfcC